MKTAPESALQATTDRAYLYAPQAIQERSFALCAQALADHRATGLVREMLLRVVHTTGDVEGVEQLRWGGDIEAAICSVMLNHKPIFCDVNMVRSGLVTTANVHCYIEDDEVTRQAKARGMTRSMVAVERWEEALVGALAIVGCAPTALFRLLELIEDGAAKPALIIGTPVGFVGAAEASEALCACAERYGVAFVSMLGRKGGSAIAAAIANSLILWYRRQKRMTQVP